MQLLMREVNSTVVNSLVIVDQRHVFLFLCKDLDEVLPLKLPRLEDSSVRQPVDLELDLVLGKMPQKIYDLIWKDRHLTQALWTKVSFTHIPL